MKTREALNVPRTIAMAAVLTIGAIGLFASKADKAPVDTAPVPVSPYEGTDVLVYAPRPLTAGEAIEYFVERDQLRADDAEQAELVAELTDDYEAQTGLNPEVPFPGNDQGTAFIRIEE